MNLQPFAGIRWPDGIEHKAIFNHLIMDITKKIKTFEDACEALGLKVPEALPEILQPKYADIVPSHVKAFMKLEIITAALNEGWQWAPDPIKKPMAYWPWFWFYDTEEVADMGKERAEEIHLINATDISGFAGLGYAYSNDAWSDSISLGSRLAFKTADLARYAGRQFIELYKEYLFKPVI